MTRRPDPATALDGLALCWAVLREDSAGVVVMLDALDVDELAEVCRFLAWSLVCQLSYPQGRAHAAEVLAVTRTVFLNIEREHQDDGPDNPVWPEG